MEWPGRGAHICRTHLLHTDHSRGVGRACTGQIHLLRLSLSIVPMIEE